MPGKDNFYQVLGVNTSASAEEIRTVYKNLVKNNHPDKFSDPEKKKEAENYVAGLSEAFNTLVDPERRKQYDEELRRVGTQQEPDAVREAKVYFKNGVAKLGQQDYETAARFFKTAIHLDKSKAAYHAHLALVLSKNRQTVGEAIRCYEEAIRLEPFNPAHYKAAGFLLKQAGMMIRAKKMFENAHKWDAADPVVQKALKELEKDDKKGFFSSLFKRSKS
jgi:curved DNA-binding protein CbpA